jgi:hypothetical protein
MYVNEILLIGLQNLLINGNNFYLFFYDEVVMKTLLYLFAVVLLYAAPLYSQKPIESQAIPELQEWWRAPADEEGLGQYGVSYLPNFYHGKDAMAVSTKDKTMETWLNRFPGDRENVFTWQTSGTVLYGDLNADGIRDYVCGTRIYRGIQNGEPPESGTIRAINMQPNMVVDVNHDGYNDIVDWYDGGGHVTGGVVAQIVYGRPDFKEMKVVQIPCASSMDSTMEMESMYMGTDGDMRILMFSHNQPKDNRRDFNGYVLFRATWKTGDSVPAYEKLAENIRYRYTDIPFQRNGAVYQGKHDANIYFITRESLGMYLNNVVIFDVTKDSFEQKIKFRMDFVMPYTLHRSLDEDHFEDWSILQNHNNSEPDIFIFSGKSISDSVPQAVFRLPCPVVVTSIVGIGDVNGDSVNDLAINGQALDIPNCFRIALGTKSANTVSEQTLNERSIFTLTDPTPHPLSRGKSAILSTNIIKSGVYYLELVDISGKHVAELKRQYLEVGSQSIMLDITLIPIASGSYILILKNETGMIIGQRTIIIE